MAKQTVTKKNTQAKKTPKGKKAKKPLFTEMALAHARSLMWLTLEITALTAVALVAVIVVLGQATARFAGVDLWANLIPFAGVVLILAMAIFVACRLWLILRRPAAMNIACLPALLASALALGVGWLALGDGFRENLSHLRSLVGGVQQAETTTLSHQVFASYRRTDLPQMQILLERGKSFESIIQEAANTYQVDAEVLMGVGAVESSFLPRDSKDGGRGLFQITAPPKAAVEQVSKLLGVRSPDWRNSRHNALIAAATWRHYLKEMNGDLFLSLLAYNIGPKNGGLLSIMRQYGAKDFVTIQPYLQNLPRDYPIRVLTAALAYRLYRTDGSLPRYEEEGNAKRIQAIGIPGLAIDSTLQKKGFGTEPALSAKNK